MRGRVQPQPSSVPPYLPVCSIAASPPSGARALLDCYMASSFLAQRPWMRWQHELREAIHGGNSSSLAVIEIATAASFRREHLEAAVADVRRWHAVTQDRLFAQLRRVWADDRPRVFLDLGCHGGGGKSMNVSDALIFLHHFNFSGSLVLGVDAFEDFAIDLKHRFDHVPPYSQLRQVQKVAMQYAVHSTDTTAPRDLFYVMAKQTIACCIGPPACRSWADDHDHHCRITRQRLGLVSQENVAASIPQTPFPASSYPPSLFEAMRTRNLSLLQRPAYPVRVGRTDSLWRQEMAGRRIDFVKVDVDLPWSRIGLEGLLMHRAFAVLTIELDSSWGTKPFGYDERHDRNHPSGWGLTDADQLAWLAARYEYQTWLKLPCRASHPGASYPGSTRDEERTASWYWPLCVNRSSDCIPTALSMRSFHSTGDVQDILLLDSRLPELMLLPAMAAEECKFPAWRSSERVRASRS